MRTLPLNLNHNLVLNLIGQIKIKIRIMITKRSQVIALVAVIAPLFAEKLAMAADETNTVKGTAGRIDYQSFRVISERNIFSPNRSSRGGDSRNYTRRETDRRRPSSAFGLIGTMSYEKGPFAFFDGTSTDYRKVLQPEDSIAGFKITQIGANYVTLQGNGKEIQLDVGGRMRKAQEGEWTVSANGEAFDLTSESDTTAADGGTESGSTNATSTAAPTGEVSDVLKRLMQKREQDLK
jgi:hypothetical protein